MPIHYMYISDCKISSNQDVKDAAVFGNAQQIAKLENVLIVCWISKGLNSLYS